MDLRELDVPTVTAFVLRHAPTMSHGRAKIMVTALRSIFQFLLQRGAIEPDLAACVLRIADWRLATIPKYLSPDEVERLLETCDRHTALGRRDQAILLLLARLGLRAGEIVAFELNDITWRTGEMTVRSRKRLPQDRLPLPSQVGEALATYIRRDRPPHPTRRVFLCTNAPRRGFTGSSTVSSIVRRALARAGLCPALKGAHLLRHSLATRMLRHGASLPVVWSHYAAADDEIDEAVSGCLPFLFSPQQRQCLHNERTVPTQEVPALEKLDLPEGAPPGQGASARSRASTSGPRGSL